MSRKKSNGFGLFGLLPLFPKKSKKKEEIPKSEEKCKVKGELLSVGYICEAAGHFAVAQFHESNTDYQEAFTAYKEGIRVLLAGAQGSEIILSLYFLHIVIWYCTEFTLSFLTDDTDRERKLLAKNKLEKYLSRAESIQDSFLSPPSTGNGAMSPVFSSPNKKEKVLVIIF